MLMLVRKFANYRLHMAEIIHHSNDINNDSFSQKFDLPSSFSQYFLRLCLNAFKLANLMISLGNLFHNAEPMKCKAS